MSRAIQSGFSTPALINSRRRLLRPPALALTAPLPTVLIDLLRPSARAPSPTTALRSSTTIITGAPSDASLVQQHSLSLVDPAPPDRLDRRPSLTSSRTVAHHRVASIYHHHHASLAHQHSGSPSSFAPIPTVLIDVLRPPPLAHRRPPPPCRFRAIAAPCPSPGNTSRPCSPRLFRHTKRRARCISFATPTSARPPRSPPPAITSRSAELTTSNGGRGSGSASVRPWHTTGPGRTIRIRRVASVSFRCIILFQGH
jgi:hypothetical protein